ncbi:MAG: hypothetical protein Q7R95_00650 [bacterium]|nr:hypothetical protein [bacterium]
MSKNVVMVSGSPLQCLNGSCHAIPSHVSAVIITNNAKHPPLQTEFQLFTCQDHISQIDVWIQAKSERGYGERKDLGYPNWLVEDQENKLGHKLPPEQLELRKQLKPKNSYDLPNFYLDEGGLIQSGTPPGRKR